MTHVAPAPRDIIPAKARADRTKQDEAHIALNFCANALDLAEGARAAYTTSAARRAASREKHASYGRSEEHTSNSSHVSESRMPSSA